MQTDRYSTSRTLHDRAQQSIVGGVNSPARAFKSVGGDPVFAASAEGCRVIDADGNSYIDYIGSWGPHIAGHTHPAVVAAIEGAARSGTSFGMSTEAEIGLAETIRDMMPAIERLRMVNSGTEATMSALRLARGYTGRAKVIKFVGCYHGHGDSFLIKAGSGALTHGVPDSAGVTPGVAADTLVADYNDLDSIRVLVADHADDIAAIIVEPVVGNMGTVPPEPGFLEGLRTIADETGAVLIFDEVMTGFRVAPGGAQERYGITPDITTLGKIVGGGLPVGAYGGKREIMDILAPLGPVYQAGTLSGNPLAVAAGRATLELLRAPGAYDRLEQAASMLTDGIAHAAKTAGVPVTINRVGSMFTVFFTPGPVRGFEEATASDTGLFARYFRGMLDRGVLLAPSQFEASFVSLAHDDDVISATISTTEEVFRHLS